MENIEELREKIDYIDNEILKLLSKRKEVSRKIGEYKKQNDLPPLDENRWQKVLDSIKFKGKQLDLSPELIENIWEIIHKYSLKEQK